MDKNTATGRDPADVAQAVLRAVRHRNKDVVLAGALPTVAIYLRTLWPALFFKLMSSRARKERKPKREWRWRELKLTTVKLQGNTSVSSCHNHIITAAPIMTLKCYKSFYFLSLFAITVWQGFSVHSFWRRQSKQWHVQKINSKKTSDTFSAIFIHRIKTIFYKRKADIY